MCKARPREGSGIREPDVEPRPLNRDAARVGARAKIMGMSGRTGGSSNTAGGDTGVLA